MLSSFIFLSQEDSAGEANRYGNLTFCRVLSVCHSCTGYTGEIPTVGMIGQITDHNMDIAVQLTVGTDCNTDEIP
jgi:hypothetical protein